MANPPEIPQFDATLNGSPELKSVLKAHIAAVVKYAGVLVTVVPLHADTTLKL